MYACRSLTQGKLFSCAFSFRTPWERMELLFDQAMKITFREYRFEKFGDGRFITVVYRILFGNGVVPS